MTITVAGEKKEYKDGLTLPELIELENVDCSSRSWHNRYCGCG